MTDVRALIVEDGVVKNAVLASEAFAASQGWIIPLGTTPVDIGWTFKDGTFSPPVTPPDPVNPFADFVPVPMVRQRIQKLGLWDDFAGYLAQFPAKWLMVLSLENGVDPEYPDFIAAFEEMEIPQVYRDYILAPPSAGVGDPPSMG